MSGRVEPGVSTELCSICPLKYAYLGRSGERPEGRIMPKIRYIENVIRRMRLTSLKYILIIWWSMPAANPEDSKSKALRAQGALHPHPERVEDEQFRAHEFFDPRDRVQVKYEMLRRHRVEGRPVRMVVALFGVSRQAYYKTDAAFKAQGLPGLEPRRRGPKRAHKFTDEILDFIVKWRAGEAGETGENAVEAVRRRFGVSLHPHSIDRALGARKKKRRAKQGSP